SDTRRLVFATCAAALCASGCNCCALDGSEVGDPKQPIELALTAITSDRSYAPIPDGGHVALVRGGQGFQMFVINIKANNVHLCGETVRAQLTDPLGQPQTPEQIVRNLVVDSSDGLA